MRKRMGKGWKGRGWEVEEKKIKKKTMHFVVSRSRLGHTSVKEIRYLAFNYSSVLKVQYCIALEPFGHGTYIDSLFSKSVLLILSDLITRLSSFLPLRVSFLLSCSDFFYVPIVGVEGYCCIWSHSVTHTLDMTPLDEWSGRRGGVWQHTTLTGRHPCHQRDSNPQSQQARGRRTTP